MPPKKYRILALTKLSEPDRHACELDIQEVKKTPLNFSQFLVQDKIKDDVSHTVDSCYHGG